MNADFVSQPGGARVYCLFCKTGREEAVARELQKHGIECLVAYTNRLVVHNRVETEEKRKLLPGYLFLETDEQLLPGTRYFKMNPDVYKLLNYEFNEFRLHGEDLAFYEWLKARGGIVSVSRVYKVGDRIKVVDGPLKAFEGHIVEVNKKRKCVAISMGDDSLMKKIWCSIEYIDVPQE